MPRVHALAVLLFLFLAGCLQFDAQEITLRYDAQKDQLSVLLVYRGLFCNGRVDEDMKQLRRCLENGEFAIWSNWPLQVNLASNLTGPRKAFADLVDVENGGIFTTPTGELCGYQMLRVRSVKQFLAQLNQLLAVAVQLQSKQQLGADRHRFDEDTLEQLQDFVRGKEPFVRLDGSAVVLNVPCSDADHFWLLNESQRLLSYELGGALARKLAREPIAPAAAGEASEASGTQVVGRVESGVPVVNGTGPGRLPDGEQFATTADRICHELERLCEARLPFENPWSMQRLDGRTVLTLGFAHRPDNVLRKGPSGAFVPNLQPALDAEAIAYEKGVPDQELLRRFGEFCGRECKLPPALAARRSGK